MADSIPRRTSHQTPLTRRQLLAGAGAGALLLRPGVAAAQAPQPAAQAPAGTTVFTHTIVVTHDGVLHDVALAVDAGRIAAIGPTEKILASYPKADVYDAQGKALL